MNNLKAHLALFAVALIYGANYTIAKEVLDKGYIEPRGFILMRVAAGAVLFWLVFRFFAYEKVKREDWGRLILCSIFGVAVNQLFFFMGLKLTTPINASLIMMTTPILVLIAGAFILRERITSKKVMGIILGLAGAALLLTSGKAPGFSSGQLLGDAMIFTNATSYGIYLVLVRKLMRTYQPFTVLAWVFALGFLWVLPFGWSEFTTVDWSSFSNGIWLAVVYVLLFTTFLAYLFNAYALKKVSATVVSVYIYLQPIIASSIAIFFAKDVLTGEKLFSAVLIFAGVFLVSRR